MSRVDEVVWPKNVGLSPGPKSAAAVAEGSPACLVIPAIEARFLERELDELREKVEIADRLADAVQEWQGTGSDLDAVKAADRRMDAALAAYRETKGGTDGE